MASPGPPNLRGIRLLASCPPRPEPDTLPFPRGHGLSHRPANSMPFSRHSRLSRPHSHWVNWRSNHPRPSAAAGVKRQDCVVRQLLPGQACQRCGRDAACEGIGLYRTSVGSPAPRHSPDGASPEGSSRTMDLVGQGARPRQVASVMDIALAVNPASGSLFPSRGDNTARHAPPCI